MKPTRKHENLVLDVLQAKRDERHKRAEAIEVIVCRDYLDENADAADIALGLLETDEGFAQTDEYLARQVAMLIEQA